VVRTASAGARNSILPHLRPHPVAASSQCVGLYDMLECLGVDADQYSDSYDAPPQPSTVYFAVVLGGGPRGMRVSDRSASAQGRALPPRISAAPGLITLGPRLSRNCSAGILGRRCKFGAPGVIRTRDRRIRSPWVSSTPTIL